MKVALCLHGLVGGSKGKNGKGSTLDVKKLYQSLKSNLLNNNDIDIFIHTWSLESQTNLELFYKPKLSLYQKRVQFDIENEKNNIFSRFFSANKALELKNQYEKHTNIEFDYVMLSRIDLLWFSPLLFHQYDSRFFYASHWNHNGCNKLGPYDYTNLHTNSGFLDFFFFSNSKTMSTFGKLCNINYIKTLLESGIALSGHSLTYKIAQDCNIEFKYTKYRGFDHEMYRRTLHPYWIQHSSDLKKLSFLQRLDRKFFLKPIE